MPSPMTQVKGLPLQLDQVQQNAANAINAINRTPFMNGIMIEGVVLSSSGVNTVNHGLGRPYQFWTIMKQNANTNVWESTPTDASQSIRLNVSANVTVTLWVA